MRHLPECFSNNRAWAAHPVAEAPESFRQLCDLADGLLRILDLSTDGPAGRGSNEA